MRRLTTACSPHNGISGVFTNWVTMHLGVGIVREITRGSRFLRDMNYVKNETHRQRIVQRYHELERLTLIVCSRDQVVTPPHSQAFGARQHDYLNSPAAKRLGLDQMRNVSVVYIPGKHLQYLSYIYHNARKAVADGICPR